MGSIWSKEPAVIIGLVVSIIVLVAQQVLASGLVTSAGSVNWLNFVISVAPLIGSLLIRPQVSSKATTAAAAAAWTLSTKPATFSSVSVTTANPAPKPPTSVTPPPKS